PGVEELIELRAPPDERRLADERGRVEAGMGPQLAAHPEDGKGARELGEAVLARRLDRERTADEALGVLAGEDLARLREFLQPGRHLGRHADQVERLAMPEPLLVRDHEARVDADPDLQPESVLRREPRRRARDLVRDPQRRARLAPRVALA